MVLWLTLIALVIGIGLIIIGFLSWSDAVSTAGVVITVISGATAAIMGIIILYSVTAPKAQLAEYKAQYKSLTYQLENNLYENDNDFGKKELYNQVQEWNADLAYCKKAQTDFWVGIFYPNIYDKLELIEYKEE